MTTGTETTTAGESLPSTSAAALPEDSPTGAPDMCGTNEPQAHVLPETDSGPGLSMPLLESDLHS